MTMAIMTVIKEENAICPRKENLGRWIEEIEIVKQQN